MIISKSKNQLLSTPQNKLGLIHNLKKLTKLLGTPKPSRTLVEQELNQLTKTVYQFMVVTEKLLTLSLIKDLEDLPDLPKSKLEI